MNLKEDLEKMHSKKEAFSLKAAFITGLVILLPIVLTFWIFSFVFDLLTAPFLGFFSTLAKEFGWFHNGFFFLGPEETVLYVSKVVSFFSVIGVTVLLGALARWFFFRAFLRIGEMVVKKIPFINTVYNTSQDVIKTIFTTNTQSFKQVVLVPFPHSSSKAVGLVTKEEIQAEGEATFVSVFVPTTPNPTSGFLLLFDKKDLVYLDMSIESAIKFVISCGVLTTKMKAKEPNLPLDATE